MTELLYEWCMFKLIMRNRFPVKRCVYVVKDFHEGWSHVSLVKHRSLLLRADIRDLMHPSTMEDCKDFQVERLSRSEERSYKRPEMHPRSH